MVGYHRVGYTNVAITYADSHQITSTSTPSQIYAKYLKRNFYDDMKFDLWRFSPEKYSDVNHVLWG